MSSKAFRRPMRRVRPSCEDPDGRTSRQSQRGHRGGGHGLSGQGKLARSGTLHYGGGCSSYETLDRHPAALLLERLPVHSASFAGAVSRRRPGAVWTLIIDDRDLTFIPAGGQPIRQQRPPADHRLRRRNLSDAADRRECRPCPVQRRNVGPRLPRPGSGRCRRTPSRRLRRRSALQLVLPGQIGTSSQSTAVPHLPRASITSSSSRIGSAPSSGATE